MQFFYKFEIDLTFNINVAKIINSLNNIFRNILKYINKKKLDNINKKVKKH